MAYAIRVSSDTAPDRAALKERLSLAHARIEASFLEGGATLVSVMEMVNSLIETLDRFTRTLDGKTAAATIDGLQRTISDLANLPALAGGRQQSFDRIADLCAAAHAHVEDMRETFRYLKVFATTVKITGAGLAEFAEFADEIRERILFGAQEIDRFSVELERMRSELSNARQLSAGILGDFAVTIPAIVSNLTENTRRMQVQHESMAKLATEVKGVAGTVQRKIATALSALQIGDITRQRIEHVQASFVLLDEYLASPVAAGLEPVDRAGVQETVERLAYAQLDETMIEFREKCASIFTTISSFSADASRILSLRDELAGSRGGSRDGSRDGAGQSILDTMERDLGEACELASGVEGRSQDSTALAGTVTQSVQALIQTIETIRLIKTDIHHMALNSNLRCSRLGDAGRSVNVVSGELRNFAGKLEAPADAVVEEMRRVETAAAALTASEEGDVAALGVPLADARAAIATVSSEMNQSIAALAEEGNAVFGRISSAVQALDFQSNLGEVLEGCVMIAGDMAAVMAGREDPVTGHGVDELSQRIYAIYTMAQERDIHLNVFPAGVPDAPAAPAASATSDEDFFEDALF